MKKFIFIFFFLSLARSYSQSDSIHFIKVHFLYGSKPLRKFKNTEPKYFGGLHGGHVSIEVDSVDYGFHPHKRLHLLSHRRKRHSIFSSEKVVNGERYRKDAKVTTVIIPITNAQYRQLNSIHQCYCKETPYDYAFIGMRCAASGQDILSQIGLVEKRGRWRTVFSTFYPKLLRKRILRDARKKGYILIKQEGRPTRKWEKD